MLGALQGENVVSPFPVGFIRENMGNYEINAFQYSLIREFFSFLFPFQGGQGGLVFLGFRTGAGACPLRLRPGDPGIYLSRPPHPPVSPRISPHLASSPRRGSVYGGGAVRPPAAAGRADRERRRRSFPAGERSGMGVVGKGRMNEDSMQPTRRKKKTCRGRSRTAPTPPRPVERRHSGNQCRPTREENHSPLEGSCRPGSEEKNFTPPLRGMADTRGRKITPPLRGSQRGKGEARRRVGGGYNSEWR